MPSSDASPEFLSEDTDLPKCANNEGVGKTSYALWSSVLGLCTAGRPKLTNRTSCAYRRWRTVDVESYDCREGLHVLLNGRDLFPESLCILLLHL